MLTTVERHDLRTLCKDCNTTLSELSQETGLPEELLLGFAGGYIGLSATDRLRILQVLNWHLSPPPDGWRPAAAYARICQEIEEEDANTAHDTRLMQSILRKTEEEDRDVRLQSYLRVLREIAHRHDVRIGTSA